MIRRSPLSTELLVDDQFIIALAGEYGPSYEYLSRLLVKFLNDKKIGIRALYLDISKCRGMLRERWCFHDLKNGKKKLDDFDKEWLGQINLVPDDILNPLEILPISNMDPALRCLYLKRFNDRRRERIISIATFDTKGYDGIISHGISVKTVFDLLEEYCPDEFLEEVKNEEVNSLESALSIAQSSSSVSVCMNDILISDPDISSKIIGFRAFESLRGDGIIRDMLSVSMATDKEISNARTLIKEKGRGTYGYIPIRDVYVDNWLLSLPSFVRQIVIFRGGPDTRAFRLEFPGETSIYEVDSGISFDRKLRSVRDNYYSRQCTYRHVVELPGGSDNWLDLLELYGFKTSIPSAFVLSGIQMYSSRQMFQELINTIATCAASSYLFADILNESAWLNKPNAYRYPWRTGFDNPAILFDKNLWELKVVEPGSTEANFGVLDRRPLPRDVPNVDRVFLCTAKLLKNQNALKGVLSTSQVSRFKITGN